VFGVGLQLLIAAGPSGSPEVALFDPARGDFQMMERHAWLPDFGVQYTRPLREGLSLMARAEALCYGSYQYDDPNTAGQDAYTLTHLRAGMRGKHAFGELWIRNAFDTRYVPTAFPYPGLAPSGFVGESGAPRTFGLRAGVSF
jgi:iron complex outermembrane receptor protein